jgi:hypothetical protein
MLLLPLLLRRTKTPFRADPAGQKVYENDEKADYCVHKRNSKLQALCELAEIGSKNAEDNGGG